MPPPDSSSPDLYTAYPVDRIGPPAPPAHGPMRDFLTVATALTATVIVAALWCPWLYWCIGAAIGAAVSRRRR